MWIPATLTQPSRESANVEAITAFVVDCDSYSQDGLDARLEALQAAGHHFLVHSSVSYAPPKKAKVRLVFFLDAPIPVGTEWRWKDALWPRMMELLGFPPGDADSACRNADRAYYPPIKRSEDAPTLAAYYPGRDVPTREWLGGILDAPLERYDYRRPYESKEDPSIEVAPADLAARLALRFPRGEVGAALALMLSATPTPEGKGRHETINLCTWAICHVAEDEEATGALVAVMKPWCDAMELRYGSRGRESWYEEAERALEGARNKKPTWDAYRAARLAAGNAALFAFDLKTEGA